MTTTAPAPATEPRHPIRVVAQRTGLTPATLRAWERRYGVVEPGRSEGGQRLYSDRDVERLVRLRTLTDAGRAISLVATLDDDAAEALLQEDREQARRQDPSQRIPATAGDASARAAARILDAAFGRILAFDGEGLEVTLRRAAVTLGAMPFLEQVVGLLLHRVGAAWTRGELGPAQEHLCTTVMEGVLSWLTESVVADADAPRMVVATLSGERHGLGARLVVAVAGLEGWHVTHLGIDLPPTEVAQAAREVGARAVAVSMVNADIVGETLVALRELAGALPHDTVLLLGGATASRLADDVVPERSVRVDGLVALQDALADLE